MSFSNSCQENMGMRKLSPFVLWSQTESDVSLRISMQIIGEPDIKVSPSGIEFSAQGTGANTGMNEYCFKLDFFRNIDINVHSHRKVMEFELVIKKMELEWWPRLTKDTKKPAWLKLDFDKLKNSDDEEDNDSLNSDLFNKTDDTLARLRSRSRKYQKRVEKFRKTYLFLYNFLQFVGFLYVTIVLNIHYAKDGPAFMEKAYSVIRVPFTFCQLLQILEVIHPLLGYTAGSPITPFMQVFGRLVMLLAMINGEPRIQSKPAVFYLIYIYSLSEVIRYPYYMLRVYNANIGFLTWLRYTVWIGLYPLGFLCEGIIILRNIPYFEETKKFSVFLPNKWNISFYFPTLMRVYLLLGLFPLLYFMMTYMYRQRKKILHVKKE